MASPLASNPAHDLGDAKDTVVRENIGEAAPLKAGSVPAPNVATTETIRAPLSSILPSFVPALLERGVPGYSSATTVQGESRLTRAQLHSILAASAYLAALDHCGKHLDGDRVQDALSRSLTALPALTVEERALASDLLRVFFDHKTIRENHPFDDWISEAWWSTFHSGPYRYPSAMSDAITYGLSVRQSLRRCLVEY
jgi:hypothetical protein